MWTSWKEISMNHCSWSTPRSLDKIKKMEAKLTSKCSSIALALSLNVCKQSKSMAKCAKLETKNLDARPRTQGREMVVKAKAAIVMEMAAVMTAATTAKKVTVTMMWR